MRAGKKHLLEGAVLVIFALSCLVWWRVLQSGRTGLRAEVITDGQIVMEIPLDHDGFYQTDSGIRFEVRDGAAAFADADCPDKICEKAGFLSKEGQTAVCIPRKTRLIIRSDHPSSAPDAAAE